ncbi:restriction endonuclease subunit S [Gemella sp. zg-570]|uniref:restriction endonuclease subunit S n=1 Tax=Gemella sp. zg-570 TaxID=2840371 RepID=UPI001C0BE141|nr:restriction endonuclease subunit S [Gemella sp. zg-570]QWQ38835.1 restriction endonuclease subunit S [Gemella sp. zg-570]
MKKYEKYKEIKLPWLKEVPEGWELKQIREIFYERKEKVSDKDFPALSVTKNGIYKQLENVAKTNDGDNRKKVLKNDFVINGRSDRKGSSGLSCYDGSVSLINIVLIIKNAYPKFIHYLLKSIPFQEEFYRNGKGIVADLWSTNFQLMKNIILPIPPLSEQTQIANFLDWKINEIDRLIELEKRKIKEIEKLKNRLINKLIKVENGNKIKIKYFCNLFGRIGWQGLNSGEYSDKGILLITGTDFKNGEINYETCVRVPYFRWEQNKNIQIKNDDLLITKDGTVGKLALVKNLKEKATLNSGIMKIEFFKDTIVTKEYLYYVLKSDIFKEWFNNLNLGVATIIHLYQRDFYNFEFFYPDIHTQEKVVIKIKNIENKFDNLLAYLESQIQNLQELKQSLISDVVTGKIDVRDIKIPNYKKQKY